MFPQFPKKRNALPDNFKAVYDIHYKTNREGKTIVSFFSQKMESWLHKHVADHLDSIGPNETLEIGAGTLNQLPYEKSVVEYDIVEPYTFLYQNSDQLKRVRCIYRDISLVPPPKKYDRITSIATFEHITDLPTVVAYSCLLLKKKGVLLVSIPNEGYFLRRSCCFVMNIILTCTLV